MTKWLLTNKQIAEAFGGYDFQTKDMEKLLKAQAKKLVEWLLGRCEHFPPEVIGQPRYQCTKCLQILCKEVGLKEVKE